MKSTIKLLVLLLLITSSSCDPIIGYKYNDGSLPSTPENLTEFNTSFDDYNSTAPTLGDLIPFCFSTNRNSNGNQFDIIFEPMNPNFDKSSGELKVTNQYDNWSSLRDDYDIIQRGIQKIITAGNEFGPNLVVDENLVGYNFTLMYSTDVTGNSQINFISNLTDSLFSEPKEIEFLNSEFEDLYPSIDTERSKLYFCSDRDGAGFNIYYAEVDTGLDTESMLLNNSNADILLDNTISSSSNDKCPFVFGNKMVFASDRAGGFGGYDLYYSLNENGSWGEPINFGESINSAADEFRPILIDEGVSSKQTMMVFSSNREGGLGGFDLYFLGIE